MNCSDTHVLSKEKSFKQFLNILESNENLSVFSLILLIFRGSTNTLTKFDLTFPNIFRNV